MGEKCWVYLQSEPGLWTVGFYDPAGKWHTDSDHGNREDARRQTAWLNGGKCPKCGGTGVVEVGTQEPIYLDKCPTCWALHPDLRGAG